MSSLLDFYVSKEGLSRAGFYKALARLKRAEVVLVKNRLVTIDRVWLAKGYQFFEQYMGRSHTSYFGEQVARLGKDESLSYSFRSLAELDTFLLNLMYDLVSLGVGKDVLIQERHEFFFAIENSRTTRIMMEIERLDGRLCLLVESDSDTDRRISKKLPNSVSAYITGAERRECADKMLHAIGDVLIELRIDKAFSKSLSTLYGKELTLERFERELRELVIKRQKHTVRIYRDKGRVRAMRSRFKKFFVLTD